MTGYTPEQVPVLNGIAKAFGVFDHWFCEVPSQTFMNRSFWMAGTSSGFVTNFPAMKWTTENTAETLFERLEAHGRTWKVYVLEPARISFTGWIHMPRLKDRLKDRLAGSPAWHRLRTTPVGLPLRWAWHTGRTLRRGLMRREDF